MGRADHRKLPEFLTSWNDIIDRGVIYPHPESTVQTLWEWINDHATLIESIRDSQLDEILGPSRRRALDREKTAKRYTRPKGIKTCG